MFMIRCAVPSWSLLTEPSEVEFDLLVVITSSLSFFVFTTLFLPHNNRHTHPHTHAHTHIHTHTTHTHTRAHKRTHTQTHTHTHAHTRAHKRARARTHTHTTENYDEARFFCCCFWDLVSFWPWTLNNLCDGMNYIRFIVGPRPYVWKEPQKAARYR